MTRCSYLKTVLPALAANRRKVFHTLLNGLPVTKALVLALRFTSIRA